MKHPVSRELFAYWDRLRNGRTAPERSDIDPAMIRGVLMDTFILGTDGAGASGSSYPVRLSGTRLNALFLSELKGRSLTELWEDADRPTIERLITTVIEDAVPIVAGLKGAPPNHRAIDLEMVLLPLRHHGRTQSRILGAIAPIELPSWLGLLSLARVSLSSLRVIAPRPHQGSSLTTDARPTANAEPDLGTARRYGRFTVHQGGR